MTSGKPGPRGDLSAVTDPAHFPRSFRSLEKKTLPQEVIWNGTASIDSYTEPIELNRCIGFSIYVKGTGNWNIEVTPNPNNPESFWIPLLTDAKSGDGVYETRYYHPWVRVSLKSGANLIAWIYKKYSN